MVFAQAGIHSGEIDGKDAMLAILRDLALDRHGDLLRGVTLLVVPVYNVDGHERVSVLRPALDAAHQRHGLGVIARREGDDTTFTRLWG